ncbi:MAG TPA: hypothetical protein VK619_04370 [Pyrinomonadaceae bacterium]|nr:hypothetical protein [Pyrinomonadaceae bacterium]
MDLKLSRKTDIRTEAIAGRRREIHPVMYALALISTGLLALEHGKFH